MNFHRNIFHAWLLAAFVATATAFSPNIPNNNHAVDSSMDAAMSQYEAALKIASESTSAVKKEAPPATYSDVSLLQHIDEQHEAMEKYEAALKAAFASTNAVSTHAAELSSNAQGEALQDVVSQQQTKLSQRQSWDTLTQEIHDIINDKEAKAGEPLSEEAKDEIISTVIAGSVLGAAVGSPLLIGAVLGFAGTQMLQGQEGDKHLKFLGTSSKQIMSQAAAQANAALAFTKEQWAEEQDLSAVSKKILQAIEANALAVQDDIQAAPSHLVENLKNTVQSEEFKQLPTRSFHAVKDFLGSERVKSASEMTVQALQGGIESEEMKALQNRAARGFKKMLRL